MKLSIAAVLVLLASGAWAEEWSVLPAPSDFPELEAASIGNAEGDRLYLWPHHGAGIFIVVAELHLANAAFAAMPRYRIDGADSVDTEQIRLAGERQSSLWGHSSGAAAFWRVWASHEPSVAADELFHRWFTGRVIEFEFAATDGTRRTASFSLGGAGAAILAATRVEAR